MKAFFICFHKTTQGLCALCLSSVILASCSADEPKEAVARNIDFNGSMVLPSGDWLASSSTRSSTTPYPTGSSFGVFAYLTGTDSWGDTGTTLLPGVMYNQLVEKTEWSTSYSPVKYWIPTKKYTFFAYSPYSAGGDHGIALSGDDEYGDPYIDFLVNDSPSQQVDFASAYAIDMEESQLPINLVFSHALSRVRFTAKVVADASQYTAEVVKLSIAGLDGDGIENSGRYDLFSKSWSSPTGNASYDLIEECAQGDGTQVPYNATSPLVDLGLPLYMLPQAFSGNITIGYVVYSPFASEPIQREEVLPVSTIWTMGSAFNYVFTIKLTEVVFSSVTFKLQVEDWVERDDTNPIVME